MFIPIAERIGVTADLTRAMLDRATMALVAWSQHELLGAASIAIDVSLADLRNRTLVDEINCLLASGQLEATRLVLEINDSSDHADVQTMSAMLAPLRAVHIEQLLLFGFRRLQGSAICEPMPVDDLGGDRRRRAVDRLVGRYRVT